MITYAYIIIVYLTEICNYMIISKTSLQQLVKKRWLLLATLVGVVLGQYWTSIIFDPIGLFVLSRALYPKVKPSVTLFYTMYTYVLSDFLTWVIVIFFYRPFLSVADSIVMDSYVMVGLSYLLSIFVLLVLHRMFDMDFSLMRHSDVRPNKSLIIANVTMLVYYLSTELSFLVSNYIGTAVSLPEVSGKSIAIFIFWMFFLAVAIYLNYDTKKRMAGAIKLEQDRHLEVLETYNSYIEQFYTNLRKLKHDYENILISLRDSVDGGDVAEIRSIYDDLAMRSRAYLQELDGRIIQELVKIDIPFVKLALLENNMIAQQKQVPLTLVVSQPLVFDVKNLEELFVLLDTMCKRAIDSAYLNQTSIVVTINSLEAGFVISIETKLTDPEIVANISADTNREQHFVSDNYALKIIQEQFVGNHYYVQRLEVLLENDF
ncbi:hypothetical protein [Streptococcus saliviloxodontae]|uniref:Histidine kinase n=1 Tax=Streptococcus saliviloxodontae TaxID=1349416 RepID=A0ABS2PPE9_9STRE|nr:hypothetical protein [Streptococcus saliviloxodontae]MBM7636850.1 hypothetical protein [Streptococcus saliviloxodontae]